MALSARAYARHRGVSHTAVQKALRAGRITALPDGTINAEVADRDWNAATEVRRSAEQVPADPTRVGLPAGSLATAEATVRAVLVEHGAPADKALTISDVRLVNEILRAKERADTIAAKKVMFRLRQRAVAMEAIDKRLVDSFVANTVQTICEYVNPRDVPEALDRLRELQVRWVPGTLAEARQPLEDSPGTLEDPLPTPKSRPSPGKHAPDESPIDRLPADGQSEGEAEHAALQAPLDERPAGGGQATSSIEEIDAMPGPIDPTVAADPRLQCGTCVNMRPDGWCRPHRFFVTPAAPACDVYYEPVPADRSSRGT